MTAWRRYPVFMSRVNEAAVSGALWSKPPSFAFSLESKGGTQVEPGSRRRGPLF
jgi:hypothetical protein